MLCILGGYFESGVFSQNEAHEAIILPAFGYILGNFGCT
jgi:hypothetical protein